MEDDLFADVPMVKKVVPQDDLFADVPMAQAAPAPQPAMSQQDFDQDVAKSILTGGRKFIEGTVGLPGDIQDLAVKGINWAAGDDVAKRILPLATSEEIHSVTEDLLPQAIKNYVSHKPKTDMGKAFEIGTQIVPGFVGLGAAGAARRQISNLAPKREALERGVDRAYGIMRQSGVTYDPQNYSAAVSGLRRGIGNTDISGNVQALLNRLDSNDMMARMSPNGAPIDIGDLEGTYQQAGSLMATREATPNDRRVLGMIRERLDDFRRTSPTMGGNMSGPEAQNLLEGARYGASRNIKDRNLLNIEETAKAMAPERYVQEVRNGVNAILRNKNARSSYSSEELKAMKRIVSGGYLERALGGGGAIGTAARQVAASMVAPGYGNTVLAMAEPVARAQTGLRTAKRLQEARDLMRLGPRRAAQISPSANEKIARLIAAGGSASSLQLE